MGNWWDNFCKEYNEYRTRKLESEIAKLEKELEGKEFPKDIKIGSYPETVIPCGENAYEIL